MYVPLLKLNFIVCLCSQQFQQFSKCLTKEYVANTLFSNQDALRVVGLKFCLFCSRLSTMFTLQNALISRFIYAQIWQFEIYVKVWHTQNIVHYSISSAQHLDLDKKFQSLILDSMLTTFPSIMGKLNSIMADIFLSKQIMQCISACCDTLFFLSVVGRSMISWGRGHLKTTNKQCTLLDIYSGSGLKGTYLPLFCKH